MAVWPVTLPQTFLIEGFSMRKQPQAISTPVSAGPPIRRRRFSAALEEVNGSMFMTKDQWNMVRSFFDDTLSGGVLPFTWVHPITGSSANFRFKADDDGALVISDSPKDGLFRVSMIMEILP